MLYDTRFRRCLQGGSVIALASVAILACAPFGAEPSDASPVEDGGSSESNRPQRDGGLEGGVTAVTGPIPAAVTCPGAAQCERVVFVSGTRFLPVELGGIALADQMCNTLAHAADSPRVLDRQFVAWLSDGTSSPLTRMVHGTDRYVRPDGAVIADNFAALISGSDLKAAISLDEDGDDHSGNVWTGTSPFGLAFGGNCQAWTGGAGNDVGSQGAIGTLSIAWTSNPLSPTAACASDPARIYCFEK